MPSSAPGKLFLKQTVKAEWLTLSVLKWSFKKNYPTCYLSFKIIEMQHVK